MLKSCLMESSESRAAPGPPSISRTDYNSKKSSLFAQVADRGRLWIGIWVKVISPACLSEHSFQPKMPSFRWVNTQYFILVNTTKFHLFIQAFEWTLFISSRNFIFSSFHPSYEIQFSTIFHLFIFSSKKLMFSSFHPGEHWNRNSNPAVLEVVWNR